MATLFTLVQNKVFGILGEHFSAILYKSRNVERQENMIVILCQPLHLSSTNFRESIRSRLSNNFCQLHK